MNALPKEPDYALEAELRDMITGLLEPISPTISEITDPHPDPLHSVEGTEHPVAQLPYDPAMEFAALDRQKHILNGMVIYEAFTKDNKAKTESDKLIDAIAELDKHNNFVVRKIIDISLEDEVLGARLQEGTNRKRARSFNLQYLNHHNRLLGLSVQTHDDEHQTTRCQSEEVDTEVCARTRSLPLLGNAAPRTAEAGHHGDDMSEGSSGTKRRLRSSSGLTEKGPGKPLASTDTSGTLEEEIAKSADQDEPVPVRGSAKLYRPDKTIKAAEEEEKELQSALSAEKDIDALPTTNAHDEKKATTSSLAPKPKSWLFYDRYQNSKSNVLPDYGPRATNPKSQQADTAMKIPGGLKPHNSLAKPSPSNSNPSFKSHRPQIPISKNKSFDLTSDASRSRGNDQNPAKRQRRENGSSTSPIDVEETSSFRSKHSGQTSVRSGHSQTLQSCGTPANFGSRGSISQEYRKVDQAMRPPKSRQRNGATSKPTVLSGHGRFTRHTLGEDANDLISDNGSSPPLDDAAKDNTEKDAHSSGYTGSAFFGPSRQSGNGTGRTSNRLPARSPEESPYFGSIQGHARNSHDQLSQDDRDELAGDPHGHAVHANTAQVLLKKNLSIKRVFSASQGLSIEVENSSEDEISHDIKPTNYGASKLNPGQVRGDESYPVFQILSEQRKWLRSDATSPWSIELNTKNGLLAVYDESDQLVFEFFSREVDRIEFAPEGTKIVLHKSRSSAASEATKIYIEMRSSDDSRDLIEKMKVLDPTLGKLPKKQDYLNRVFINIDQKAILPKKSRATAQGEPDDIRLAKARAEKRQETQWISIQNAKKASGNANGTRQKTGSLDRGSRSEGLARNMRGPPESNDVYEVAGHRQSSNASATVLPGAFYGTSEGPRANGAEGHGTRSSGRATAPIDMSPTYRQSPRQRLRPRSPSPEPDRWTFENPDWVEKEGWQTSVIYPPEGKNKASVDMQDIQRLDEGEFLNDNLIVFYLRWLEDRLVKDNPELASRIYFTNTFFYERLTKNVRGKSGGINYEAVERWTSKIDLLKYDYIVVPVNETVHWYVAIICNAPKLLRQPSEKTSQPKDKSGDPTHDSDKAEVNEEPVSSPTKIPAQKKSDEVDVAVKELTLEDSATKPPSPDTPETISDLTVAADIQQATQTMDLDSPISNVVSDAIEQQASETKQGKRKSLPPTRRYNPEDPRIITLDSLGLAHSPTCTNLKRYLMQEIKAKKNIEIEDPGALGTKAKNIPQQNNHCDCGLFLLTYIEEFLKKPDAFINDILQHNEQDFKDWRSASNMRKHIRNLLFDLQREQTREANIAKREKSKAKQAAKAADKTTSTSSSMPASREATKSAPESPSPEEGQGVVDSRNVHHEKSRKRPEVAPGSLDSPQQNDADLPSTAEPLKPSVSDPDHDQVPENAKERPGMITRFLGKTTADFIHHYIGHEELPELKEELPDVKGTGSQPIALTDSQEINQDSQNAATPSPVKKPHKRKASRAPSPEELQGPKISRPNEAIEVPESPRATAVMKGSLNDETVEEMVVNRHPLPYSSQGEEQDEHRSSRLPERSTMVSDPRGRKTKIADYLSIDDDPLVETSGIEANNPDTSLSRVQLIEVKQKQSRNAIASRQQQDNDDELLLRNTPPPTDAPPGPPRASLLSSSPNDTCSDVSIIEPPTKNRPRSRVAQSSPRNAKRPSDSATENESLSAKRTKRRRTSVINLVEDSPTAKPKISLPDSRFRDASDIPIVGEEVLRRLSTTRSNVK